MARKMRTMVPALTPCANRRRGSTRGLAMAGDASACLQGKAMAMIAAHRTTQVTRSETGLWSIVSTTPKAVYNGGAATETRARIFARTSAGEGSVDESSVQSA